MEHTFILNEPVKLEETLHCEFKEVRGGKPLKAIANAVDEYVVAFLNCDGGSIFWGSRDSDRKVVGVCLSYRERDDLRNLITNKLTGIQPPVSPVAYQMHLHEVFENHASEAPVPDLAVTEVVAPRPSADALYFTGGNEAFVKTPAGKKKLSGPELTDELFRRLQSKLQDDKPVSRRMPESLFGFSSVLKRASLVSSAVEGAQILWVDDNPGNNIYERMVLKTMGINADVAVSTDEALLMLSMDDYDVVISDMERGGNHQAGLQLLHSMREHGLLAQVVFYIGGADEKQGTPPGAFGITCYPDDLLHYVLDILERQRIK